jgi:S1-C subfamily serine protease
MKNNISVGGKTLSALLVGASVWMSPAVLGLAAATAAAPVTGAVIGLPDFADLVDKVGPAVVNIRTTERVRLGQGGRATKRCRNSCAASSAARCRRRRPRGRRSRSSRRKRKCSAASAPASSFPTTAMC